MLTWLRRIGLRKGIAGGQRNWLIVGLLAAGLRRAGSMARRQEDTLTTERLAPGQSIVITNQGKPPKRSTLRRSKPLGKPKARRGRGG